MGNEKRDNGKIKDNSKNNPLPPPVTTNYDHKRSNDSYKTPTKPKNNKSSFGK